MADVESCDRVAEVQRRCADQQVFECDAYPAGSLFALNLPGELSDFECYWMDEHVTAQFLRKFSSAFAVGIALSPVDAMS